MEHANVLELCYIELLSGDGSPYSLLSVSTTNKMVHPFQLLEKYYISGLKKLNATCIT